MSKKRIILIMTGAAILLLIQAAVGLAKLDRAGRIGERHAQAEAAGPDRWSRAIIRAHYVTDPVTTPSENESACLAAQYHLFIAQQVASGSSRPVAVREYRRRFAPYLADHAVDPFFRTVKDAVDKHPAETNPQCAAPETASPS